MSNSPLYSISTATFLFGGNSVNRFNGWLLLNIIESHYGNYSKNNYWCVPLWQLVG